MDEELSARSALDLSYRSYRVLPASAAIAYQALGVHPGTVFRSELVAAATNSAIDEARAAIDRLVKARLVDELDDGYFRMHGLTKTHARALAETGAHRAHLDPRTVRKRMIEWYLLAARTAGHAVLPARRVLDFRPHDELVVTGELARPEFALRWMERQRPDLLTAVRAADEHGWSNLAYLLADAMQPLFLIHKDYLDAVDVGAIGLRAALALRDDYAETTMRKHLARAYIRLNRLTEAHLQIVTLIEGARTRNDRRAEASGLKTLGMLHAESGHFEAASASFAQALMILRELGRHGGEGLLLIELGTALSELGRLDDAVSHLTRAKTVLSALSTPDRLNAARAGTVLGRVHVHMGKYERAQQELQTALSVLTELGFDADRARTHQALAEFYAACGDEAAAQAHRDTAASILSRPGPKESF